MFRAVRWVMRGFDAADSERTVRPESPTSPNVEIGPTAKKTSVPNARGRIATQGIRPPDETEKFPSSSDELDSEKMRRVMAESSLHFLHTLEQHRDNDILWPVLKPAVRTTTTLGALQVRVCEVFRVVRAVDTIDGQFHRLDLQGRRRRRAPRQHLPDLPLEYEPRPQNGTGK